MVIRFYFGCYKHEDDLSCPYYAAHAYQVSFYGNMFSILVVITTIIAALMLSVIDLIHR